MYAIITACICDLQVLGDLMMCILFYDDLMREAVALADKQLAGRLYASSTAPQAWRMIVSLGPLTRAELARALGVTKRTASQSVSSLQEAGMVRLRETDSAMIPANADLVPRE